MLLGSAAAATGSSMHPCDIQTVHMLNRLAHIGIKLGQPRQLMRVAVLLRGLRRREHQMAARHETSSEYLTRSPAVHRPGTQQRECVVGSGG